MAQPTPAPLERAIQSLANRESLSESLAALVFGVVMRGEATPAQVGGLLLALRIKGETADEVAGAARALRDAMVRVEVDVPYLVDTAGTGGGAVTTLNISTGAALVAAGAGATVAKHGNRSFTSRCGSADVFEALGVSVGLDAVGVARVLREVGIAFLFAPNFLPLFSYIFPIMGVINFPSPQYFTVSPIWSILFHSVLIFVSLTFALTSVRAVDRKDMQ